MRKATLLLLALGLAVATTAYASSPVRISQVYGGGGSYYRCDYVELFNNSNAPVDIGGWSVQYASSSGASFGSSTYNYALIPSGATIPGCGYYLIRGYCGSAGADLPVTPDLAPSSPASWLFNLSGTAGKVALFSDQVFGRTCADAQAVAVDLVGYGAANCSETAAAPTSDVSSVLVRASGGAVDTDNNSTDFSKVAEPWPMHNSASAPNPECQQAPPDAPTLVGPLDGAIGVAVPATLAVTVSDPDADALTVQFYGRAVPPPPAVPVATTGTNVYSTSFQANWDAASGATSYRLDVATDNGFTSYVVGYQDRIVSGTSRAVVDLTPETPYYYRVRAVGDGGTSGNSNTITVTTSTAPPPSAECELIILPDTQEYTKQELGGLIGMFTAQTQWIVNNRVDRNIVGVAHEGDITDKWNATEYDRSLTAMTKLEDPATTGLADGIPYGMLMGNHDDDNPALFNQYYGVSRFSGRSYYGGHYSTTNDHNYTLFSGAGRDFVVVSLSYAPSSAVLTWAKGVLEANPNRVGIVVSHSILNESETIPASWTSEGSTIYNALQGTANLRLMFCGHMSNSSSSPSWHGEGRRTDTYGGYTIHSVLADYQDRESGGNGKLRILQFVPAENKVRVRTYSPYTNVWEADADSSSQFTLDVDLSVPQPQAARVGEVPRAAEAALADFALLGTVAGVPSGSTASFEWAGLDALTEYQWFVRVSDGYTPPVTGPTWDFTTRASSTGVEDWSYGGLALGPPAPNPARGALRLSFDLPRAMHARLEVLDVQGRVVATLAEGDFSAGRHERAWDASAHDVRAGAGLYFVRLVTPEGRLVRRVALLR
jgi:hypothetical protein